MEFDMVVEVPRGSRNKYEMDHSIGRIRLDRELFTATFYPADYGYIPNTLGEDGDPLDALVVLDEPTFPGCVVACRPVGVFWMTDEKGPDAKILAAPLFDVRRDWTDLDQMPPHLLREIEHFFEIYKDLEPGKSTETRGWRARLEAEAEIERSRRRFVEAGHPSE